MTMEELLKSLGLEKEKIAEITDKMKENKIYTVGEENLDIRYGRLKGISRTRGGDPGNVVRDERGNKYFPHTRG